tara:strand:- start:1424 stop:1813 length:390 start_codon:yes stop_codon:yes gene_type:complete
MTNFKTATLIAASILLFAGTNAFAGEQVKSDEMNADKAAEMNQESETSETAATTSAVVTFTKTSEDPRVLGAIARGDMVKVQDNKGDVYLNRFVPVAELPDPELDVDTVESYTYEYNGRVYTNKVVNEK